jgi:hypothetical protein
MDRKDKEKMIPDQRVGNKLDTVHEFIGKNENEAQQVFQMAVKRLLNVNVWDKVCGPLSAKFTLTDEQGRNIVRHPEPGDHFKIDVPGPGPSSGDGYDWVQVEAVDDKRNPGGLEESLTIRVRPASNPGNPKSDTAHFFKRDATSSFRVRRIGNVVKAEVHGRNEIPNTNASEPADKVRNAVVGTGAVAGLSNPQWRSLVKGLLDPSITVA